MTRSTEPRQQQHSKSRACSGGSSSRRKMDPDVREIPPPTTNFAKQKEAILHDVVILDDYPDLVSEDYMEVDQFASNLQQYFDNVDIPTGIEAPIPWFADYANNYYVADPSLPSLSLVPINPETQQGPSAGSSGLQINVDAITKHPSGVEASSPVVEHSQTPLSKKKPNGPQQRRRKLNSAFEVGSSESSFESKKKPNNSNASNHGFVDNFEAMQLPHVGGTPHGGDVGVSLIPLATPGIDGSYYSNFVGPSFHHPGTESINHMWSNNTYHLQGFPNYDYTAPHFQAFPNYNYNYNYTDPHLQALHNYNYNYTDPHLQAFPNYNYTATPFVHFHAHPGQLFYNNWVHHSVGDGNNEATANSTVATISDEAREEILRKFRNFKQFDVVEDVSDHHFVHASSSMKQHSKLWAKRIQEEWKSLKKDLPDSIFVRVYESRIDILRAVIIGAEGTPYHDGLFFFDVFFPSGYPNVPPQVHYHSGGLRLNPNLYNTGKVCLSLLNTWSGHVNEKWLPGVSTILQVLVSIQGLILVAKPFFNEPGYVSLRGSKNGEISSLRYNEDTFILSLRTMVYIMRRSPKNFEDFVVGHFCSRAHDVMVACKAYLAGAQVGCVVKGGVQDVDQGDKSCSTQFKRSLAALLDMLVRDFKQIGAKDCDKVFQPTAAGNPSGKTPAAAKNPSGEMPDAATFP